MFPQDPIKEHFDGKPPYIKYSRGDDNGLVGFYKPLSEDDINFVKNTIKTINKNEVTWSLPTEEEEKQFEIERAQAAARSAFTQTRNIRTGGRAKGGSRGRGGGRGRGRGRGGGGRSNGSVKEREAENEGKEPSTGNKRKRAVEPDGAPDAGIRGNLAPPIIQTTKKVKTSGGEAAPASVS